MLQANSPTAPKREPHVAVCVDKAHAYGRGILMGLADYMDLFGRWSLYVDIHSTGQLSDQWLRRWRGDGILAYLRDPRLIHRLKRSGIPTVETTGLIDAEGLSRAVPDNFKVGRMAAAHLLERRFRNLAYTGYGDCRADEERYRGFASGSGPVPCHRFTYPRQPPTPGGWERSQTQLADWLVSLPKPVGVMAMTDNHALRVLDACRRCGMEVPDTVAVIGVDNDEDLCRLCNPPLSSVVLNSRKIGFAAAKLLHELMSGRVTMATAGPVLIPPLHVVTRRSSDTFAIEDPIVAAALAFIKHNAFDPIGVSEVARATGTARKTLYRHFQEALGRTPHEEILRLRLHRAKVLLGETKLGLSEIAESAGFRTASYFSYAFKENTGSTPGEYRASVQTRPSP